MCRQAFCLQQVGQRLRVGFGIVLVGTLTGTEHQAVFFGLCQSQLVGNALFAQIQQGRGAQYQIILLAAPEAGQIIDAGKADGPRKLLRAAQAAVHCVHSAQINAHTPQPGALCGTVQGQHTGSQLSGKVDEILFFHLGPAAHRGIAVQHGLTIDAVSAEQLHLAFVQQLGDGVRHTVVLPIVKAAAAGGQSQHRHTGAAIHLELHFAVQHTAPLFVIGTLDHKSSTPCFYIHQPGHSRCAPALIVRDQKKAFW